MPLASRLRSRLVAIASLSTIASCGSSGGSDVGTTAPAGSAGTTGAGGGSTGGAGGSGASAGTGNSTGGNGGSTAIGGTAGSAGTTTGGAAGASGASSAVPCPPADTESPLICYGGAGKEPDGCGVGTAGGDIGCYEPGTNGAPASPCLSPDDASLAKLLGTPCESYSNITGPPTCRTTTFFPPNAVPVPACCYAAKVQGMCKARPFYLNGTMRTAMLKWTNEWAA